jgi:hypothetical protein
MLPNPLQIGRSTSLEMKRVEPSTRTRLTPPGWRLEALVARME